MLAENIDERAADGAQHGNGRRDVVELAGGAPVRANLTANKQTAIVFKRNIQLTQDLLRLRRNIRKKCRNTRLLRTCAHKLL